MSEPRHALALTDRLLLRSGLTVSPVCLGLVSSPELVPAAFEAGVNFFFVSADMHWPLYEPLRLGLRALLERRPSARNEIVVAAVSYVTQPEFCYAPFYEVIDAVPELGHIDLGVIGGSYPSDFFVRLAQYERVRPAGMRGIGATFHHRESAITAIEHDLLDIAFIRYNAGHAGAESDVFPYLKAKRSTKLFNFKSTSGYVPVERLHALGVGAESWHPEPVDHYRFALRRPEIDGVLCGFGQVDHIAALSAAMAGAPLSEREADYMKTLALLDAGEIEVDPGELDPHAADRARTAQP
jgi:hypothetical protein